MDGCNLITVSVAVIGADREPVSALQTANIEGRWIFEISGPRYTGYVEGTPRLEIIANNEKNLLEFSFRLLARPQASSKTASPL
jgi:hypothetical protein